MCFAIIFIVDNMDWHHWIIIDIPSQILLEGLPAYPSAYAPSGFMMVYSMSSLISFMARKVSLLAADASLTACHFAKKTNSYKSW